MRLRLLLGLAIIALVVPWQPAPVIPAPPQEAACSTLGARCYCARTLRATSWAAEPTWGANAYRESDQDNTDPKLCGLIAGNSNRVIYSTWGAPTVGPGINGLPSMQVGTDSGATGLIAVEPPAPGSSLMSGRVGIRYYFWNSPTYETTFAGSSGCDNDKYIQMGTYWTSPGPGTSLTWHTDGTRISPDFLIMGHLNRWIRLEMYLNGSWPNFTSTTLIVKDLTSGLEASGTSTNMTEVTPSLLFATTQFIHRYRAAAVTPPAITCLGYTQLLYLMVAQNLGASERIPVASEIEGGGPPPTPPTAPSGLRVCKGVNCTP